MLNTLLPIEISTKDHPRYNEWQGASNTVAFDEAGWRAHLRNLEQSCYIVSDGERLGITHEPSSNNGSDSFALLASVAPIESLAVGQCQLSCFPWIEIRLHCWCNGKWDRVSGAGHCAWTGAVAGIIWRGGD